MKAEPGIVKTQAQTMLPATPQRTAENFRADPTPMIEPVMVWVVDTGTPNPVAMKSMVAPLAEAQKPPTGLSLVIRIPIVLTMRHPPKSVPSPIAAWQASTTQKGSGSLALERPEAMSSIQMMPMVFCASLPPWPRLYSAAETYCSRWNQRSIRRGVERTKIQDTATMSAIASRKPHTGETTMAAAVLRKPLATSLLVPPLAIAAPASPPISACEELDGMP